LHLEKAFSLPPEARVKGLVNFLLQMICNKAGRLKLQADRDQLVWSSIMDSIDHERGNQNNCHI